LFPRIFILAVLSQTGILLGADTVWVDDDYTTNNSGGHTWGTDAFGTIQVAVSAVASNGTVHVAAGKYDGATIAKTLTLQGANAGTAGFDARADESVITSALKVVGQNQTVAIDGFAFSGIGSPLLCGGAPATTMVSFRNNVVTGCGPIHSPGVSNWRGLSVAANKFADTLSRGGWDGNAMVIWKIGSLTVAGNLFTNIGWNAVNVVGVTNLTITGNICHTAYREAFKLGGPIGNGLCANNTVIDADLGREPDAGGVRIRVEAGSAYSMTIVSNYIENSFSGLAVRKGDILAGARITVAENSFVGNVCAGVYNGGTGTVCAADNYWGSVDGPSGAGLDGSGNAVVGDVVVATYHPRFGSAVRKMTKQGQVR